jgi:hypothetical protein
MIFIIGTAMYLQKLLLHICITANLIHSAAFATARETPKIAFAPNFDFVGTI